MGFYDSQDDSIKTVHERCREYYSPAEFVVVMNIDTEPFTYTIQRPENVTIHQPSPVEKELYYLKDPDTITLQPGQTRMVPAYEADHIIKQLMDRIVLRRRGKVIEDGGTPKESVMDPATQRKYITQIYQGKRDFMSEYNDSRNAEEKSKEAIEKALEDDLEPAAAKPSQRPAKSAA
jgi:hypothetical protein